MLLQSQARPCPTLPACCCNRKHAHVVRCQHAAAIASTPMSYPASMLLRARVRCARYPTADFGVAHREAHDWRQGGQQLQRRELLRERSGGGRQRRGGRRQ
eukprot:366086-Chlamydomonas_euryale.AAC.19